MNSFVGEKGLLNDVNSKFQEEVTYLYDGHPAMASPTRRRWGVVASFSSRGWSLRISSAMVFLPFMKADFFKDFFKKKILMSVVLFVCLLRLFFQIF